MIKDFPQRQIDYSRLENWLTRPALPAKNVDVFYLYPTVWKKTKKTEPNICAIDNSSMLKNSKIAYARQASAFETVGNIFAPYYRQIDAAYQLSLSPAEQQEMIQGTPKKDIISAFDYFVKHYNNDRPFILAGHSQGSDLLTYLLAEYMIENPRIYKRMIAAYVIGYSITHDYLRKNNHLRFAEGSDDTGVIISYNTEAEKVEGENPVVLPDSLVINPLNWSREENPAAAEENPGSLVLDTKEFMRLYKAGKAPKVEKLADARIDKSRGVVICRTVDPGKWAPGNGIFPKGVYHNFDYPFYYYSIRENAAKRAAEYFTKS